MYVTQYLLHLCSMCLKHCEEDDSVKRPIENSLSSFEYCWGAGVHLAECDVISSFCCRHSFPLINKSCLNSTNTSDQTI